MDRKRLSAILTACFALGLLSPAGVGASVGTEPAQVSLVTSHNPSVHGQSVTLTAKVTPGAKGAPTPEGTVAFVEKSTTLGVASLNVKGIAKFSTQSLEVGEHDVRVEYGGDGYFGPSESPVLVQDVDKATTELVLKSSRNPGPYGSATTLTATLKVLLPGSGVPDGTITFLEDGTPVAIVPLGGKKVATYSLKGHPPGTGEYQALFSGDTGYEASESAPLNQTITKAATELVLKSSRNPAPTGYSATLTATLKVLPPGSGVPGGAITFLQDGSPVASVPLEGKKVARYSLKGHLPGVFEFAAVYGGDTGYEASDSTPLVQLIAPYLPEITTIDPNSGPEPGGSLVSVEGQNLTHATEVKFGSTPAQSFEVISPTLIEAVSPPGSGTVDVTVTTPGGTSAVSAADRFNYLPPHAVDAYWNYTSATLGHAMCRGNPDRPESMPGGTAAQTFTIPAGVAEISSAMVQIDPDTTVTAHLTLKINGTVRATTSAAAVGDTKFNWPPVAVKAGDAASLSITFTATFGKIITVYSAAAVGGTLTYSNSCPDGAPSGTTSNGRRAVVSGLSP
jgi:Bacterial Ig-like domain (group 3)/IPT/TIG domain